MISRERILAAISHRQPDRVPIDLCSTGSSGISVVAYQNLIKYIGKEHLKTYAYDVIQGLVQPEMEFLDYFGVDVVDIGRHFNTEESYWKELELIKGHKALYPHWLQTQTLEDGSVGIIGETGEIIGRMPVGVTFFDQTIFPFLDGYPDNYDNLGNEMKRVIWGGVGFTPWDWSGRSDFWKMLRQKTIELRNSTDKALLIGVGCNLFEWGTFLRRMDNFLMDLYLEPENVHNLLDKLMERHMETLERTCEAIGDVADIIKFGDDLGTNKGPFIPVEIYDEFFKPRHKQMCDYVKANSSMHTMLHSCGGIYDLIPGLIEAGFEILNPVQINAENMEPERLKREFGSSITFWGGGCDTKSVLNTGTEQEIKEHVKSNINVFNKSGGFVFNTVHNIMSDIKPESIVAMFEAVNELNG
jgi:uroporphyrinogen decarboxylase